MTGYSSIKAETTAEYIEKRSRFIAVLAPVKTIEEGLSFWAAVKKKYRDARHYPYAIISAPSENAQKASDDGEPQGTAGIQLLDALKKRGLSAVALVVVRYFGGIKLGTGGLTLAFRTAAQSAVETAETVQAILSDIVTVKLKYDEVAAFENAVSGYSEIVSRDYMDGVVLTIATYQPDDLHEALKKYTLGREKPLKKTTEYYFYKGV